MLLAVGMVAGLVTGWFVGAGAYEIERVHGWPIPLGLFVGCSAFFCLVSVAIALGAQ